MLCLVPLLGLCHHSKAHSELEDGAHSL